MYHEKYADISNGIWSRICEQMNRSCSLVALRLARADTEVETQYKGQDHDDKQRDTKTDPTLAAGCARMLNGLFCLDQTTKGVRVSRLPRGL